MAPKHGPSPPVEPSPSPITVTVRERCSDVASSIMGGDSERLPRRLHRDRALRMPPHGASSTVYVDAATSKFAVIRNVPPSSLSSSTPPVAPSSLSSASAWKATRIATASATTAPPRPSMRTGAPSTSAVNRANSRRSRARTAAALRGDDARDRCPGLFAKTTGRTTTVTSRGRMWSLMR